MKEMLRTERLCKYFGGVCAINELDIAVEDGEIHGLLGPNGSGKSTFFNVVTGLIPATSGKVYFSSTDITEFKPEVIANIGIGRTFQTAKLVGRMSVLENVMCGRCGFASRDIVRMLFRRPFVDYAREKEIRQRALQALEVVGMTQSAERWASGLAWVECQLLQIARSLISEPKLLLLDEPTAGMGIEESKRVAEIIKRIRDAGTTVIAVSHDIRMITGIADRITVLDFGTKISEGTPEQIQNDQRVLEVYLGREEDRHSQNR